MTQYRWKGRGMPGVYRLGPGPWREFLTLAKYDAVAGGGTGAEDEIESRPGPEVVENPEGHRLGPARDQENDL